jgi:hypothetical protein
MGFTPQMFRAEIRSLVGTAPTIVIPGSGGEPRQLGTVVICNTSSAPSRIFLCVLKDTDRSASTVNAILWNKEIPGDDTLFLEHHEYLVLNPGDRLVAFASNTSFTVHASVR